MDSLATKDAVRIEPAAVLRVIWIITAIVLIFGYLREIIGALQGTPPSRIAFYYIALDKELSIPTWWSSLLLAIAGSLMLLSSMLERRQQLKSWHGWRWLGIGFLYMSMDEAASSHENFGALLRGFSDPTGGFLSYRWVIVGLFIVAVVGLVFLPFLLRLPRVTALRLIIAGAVFVTGSIGMEMLGASVREDTSFLPQALMLLEETLEMIGVVLGIRAVLLHQEFIGSPLFRIGPRQ